MKWLSYGEPSAFIGLNPKPSPTFVRSETTGAIKISYSKPSLKNKQLRPCENGAGFFGRLL